MSNSQRQSAKPGWFLERRNWTLFMIREITAVFIAAYLIFLLVFLSRVAAGAEAFEAHLAALTHPLSVVGHALVLVAALWHAVTWFKNSSQIMPVFIGGRRLPDVWVAIATGYAPLVIISLLVIWAARS